MTSANSFWRDSRGFAASLLGPETPSKYIGVPFVVTEVQTIDGVRSFHEKKCIIPRSLSSVFIGRSPFLTALMSAMVPAGQFVQNYMEQLQAAEDEADLTGEEFVDPPFPTEAAWAAFRRWRVEFSLNMTCQVARCFLQNLVASYCSGPTACRLIKDMTKSIQRKRERLSRRYLLTRAPVTAFRCHVLYTVADLLVIGSWQCYRVYTDYAEGRWELCRRSLTKLLVQYGTSMVVASLAVGLAAQIAPSRSHWAYSTAEVLVDLVLPGLLHGFIFPQPPGAPEPAPQAPALDPAPGPAPVLAGNGIVGGVNGEDGSEDGEEDELLPDVGCGVEEEGEGLGRNGAGDLAFPG